MSIEEIKKEIISDAEKKKNEIIANAKKEAARIIKEAEKKAASILSTAEKNANEEAEKIIKRQIANAKIKARSIVLKEKKKFVEKVIKESIEELRKSKNYRENLERKIKELEKNASEIFVSHADFDFINGEIKSKKIKKSKISAGFIAKLGDIEIEATPEAMLKIKEDEILREINKILFMNHDKK